jgi:TIR domain
MSSIRLFISHASRDKELTRRVVALLRAALNLPGSAIRCTSVDGHRLEGGADTDESLRNDIGSADAFLGILSNSSMGSPYVLIELGGRWVLGKYLLLLLAPGTPHSVLGGPLAGKNALRADSEAQLHQLVREVAAVLQVNAEPADVYLRQLQDVREWVPRRGRQSARRRLTVQRARSGMGVPRSAGGVGRAIGCGRRRTTTASRRRFER